MLHSAFWTHGVTDLELPWPSHIISKFTDTFGNASESSNLERARVEGTAFDGYLLDFLYPTRAITFFSKYTLLSPRRLVKVRRKFQSANPIRGYSSCAVDLTAPAQQQPLETTSFSDSSFSAAPLLDPVETINQYLERGDTEEAWNLFSKSFTNLTDRGVIERLYNELAASKRKVDLMRSVEIFERFVIGKNHSCYQTVISTCLKIHNPDKALALFEFGLRIGVLRLLSDQGRSITPATMLLDYSFDRKDWRLAFRIWNCIRNSDGIHNPGEEIEDPGDVLWNAIEKRRPALWHEIHHFIKFVSSRHFSIEKHKAGPRVTIVRQFVRDMIHRVFIFNTLDRKYNSVVGAIRTADNWGLATNKYFEDSILSFIRTGLEDRAMRLYTRYRQSTKSVPSAAFLDELIVHYTISQYAKGVQMVTEDYYRCHGGLQRDTYRKMMTQYAKQGDVAAVEGLFARYCSKFGRPQSNADLRPLLIMHATRAEPQLVLQKFEKTYKKFDMTPDVADWNILISAYAKIEDVEGAFNYFKKFKENGLRPDFYTFGTLMGLCANRGDVEAVEEIIQEVRQASVPYTSSMFHCLVLAHVKNDDLARAEEVAEQAVTLFLRGSRTRMWNYLLHAYASRRDLKSLSRVRGRMHSLSIPLNSFSYTALIECLSRVLNPDAARKVLMVEMPSKSIKASAHHYAILMNAYVKTREPSKVFDTYRRMVDDGIKPGPTSKLCLIQARAIEDSKRRPQPFRNPRYKKLTNNINRLRAVGKLNERRSGAELLLEEIITRSDKTELAVKEPMKGVPRPKVYEEFQAAWFQSLLSVEDNRTGHDKVNKFLDKYPAVARINTPGDASALPFRLLVRSMIGHLQRGENRLVQECWDTARQMARNESRRKGTSDGSEGVQILRHRRFRLSDAFIPYLKSLAAESKAVEIVQTLKDMRREGFSLTSDGWNRCVEILASSDEIPLAFQISEEQLMDNFPGWANVSKYGVSRRLRRLDRRLASQGYMARSSRPLAGSGAARPDYRTLVYLKGAWLNLDDSITASRLAKICPRTVVAIQTMPKVRDELQSLVLRRWDRR